MKNIMLQWITLEKTKKFVCHIELHLERAFISLAIYV